MLEVRLLGQFELRRNGAVVLLPSWPTQSLLTYLALSAGTAHRREKLAGLLWPDAEEGNASNSLRHALWRIRKAVESEESAAPYLLADELAVSFTAGADCWLDVAVLPAAWPPNPCSGAPSRCCCARAIVESRPGGPRGRRPDGRAMPCRNRVRVQTGNSAARGG